MESLARRGEGRCQIIHGWIDEGEEGEGKDADEMGSS